ncbi:MAG: HAMP domain-containing histidine kinase [Oscillospiraceae bacterium]|nr:HAMP domain-containing histidine kinase [Oscillospiraceae bacterium]
MGKIKKLPFLFEKLGKKRSFSLKWSFFLYLPICAAISFAGAFGIGIATNYAQEWYRTKYAKGAAEQDISNMEIRVDYDGNTYVYRTERTVFDQKHKNIYFIISNAQVLLIPLWVIFCLGLAGVIFYERELKKPFGILMNASKRISENDLDFEIWCEKRNELGQLCSAFEEMRSALYESNREMWRSLEERKRLNSAFSHDLRTPLTVLKGYTDYLEKYVPEGKISGDKMLSVLSSMSSQISRLENYTATMNSVQKLEDIAPDPCEVYVEELKENLDSAGDIICKNFGDKKFSLDFRCEKQTVFADAGLIVQVYENLVSNAARYAESKVTAVCIVYDDMLSISVSDDGKGFSPEALRFGTKPFFRGEKDSSEHFGLGLYICRVICGKCGGSLKLSNINGGNVTAEFSLKK